MEQDHRVSCVKKIKTGESWRGVVGGGRGACCGPIAWWSSYLLQK